RVAAGGLAQPRLDAGAVEGEPGPGRAEHDDARPAGAGGEFVPELGELVPVERVADAGVELGRRPEAEFEGGEHGQPGEDGGPGAAAPPPGRGTSSPDRRLRDAGSKSE